MNCIATQWRAILSKVITVIIQLKSLAMSLKTTNSIKLAFLLFAVTGLITLGLTSQTNPELSCQPGLASASCASQANLKWSYDEIAHKLIMQPAYRMVELNNPELDSKLGSSLLKISRQIETANM